MIRTWLKAMIAGFRRNTLAVSINLIGLTLCIASILCISFYIRKELDYDAHHPDADRIYRITEVINSGSYIENSSSIPFPMGTALANDFPDYIEEVVRIFDFQIPTKPVKLENNELFSEKQIYYVDSNFFKVFDLNLLVGSRENVLNQPNQMIVSEELAQKWFGTENPIGKAVFLAGSEKLKCTITGIFRQDHPSHFKPRALVSMGTVLAVVPWLEQNWVWNPHWTYVKLKPGVAAADLERQLPSIVQQSAVEMLRDMVTLHMQPLKSIHLDSHLEFEISTNSDRKFIFIFSSCAFFLVLIAIVNFVNLTTATLTSRTRETGVRIVSGASRGELIRQFIAEALVITLIAFILGIGLLLALQPALERLMDLQIQWQYMLDPGLLMIYLLLVICIAVFAGVYPAILLSRIPVPDLFRGGFRTSRRARLLRNVLVSAQFGTAVVLIVFTMMANSQFTYMRTQNPGFDAENVISLSLASTPLPGQLDAFRQDLLRDPRVKSMTIMNESIGVTNNNHEFRFGDMKADEWRYMPALCVDEHFCRTMSIPIIAGRDYDPEKSAEDSLSIVVNRSMAEYLGYSNPEDAVGQPCRSISGTERIIGVTENFHFKSFHNPIGPFVLDIESRNQYNFYLFAKQAVLKLSEVSPAVLQHVQTTWEKYVQNAPFTFSLLRDEHEALYAREDVMNKVLLFFSLLSILIACSGLFAMTRILSAQKAKELAIRKTLGAGLPHLMYVATREQLRMIGLSILIAVPLAYVFVGRWLESFAFRVNQGVDTYLLAIALALFIALCTMLFLALRAGRRDPAMVLKCE